eukprot:493488-Rhodomonas_salina.1
MPTFLCPLSYAYCHVPNVLCLLTFAYSPTPTVLRLRSCAYCPTPTVTTPTVLRLLSYAYCPMSTVLCLMSYAYCPNPTVPRLLSLRLLSFAYCPSPTVLCLLPYAYCPMPFLHRVRAPTVLHSYGSMHVVRAPAVLRLSYAVSGSVQGVADGGVSQLNSRRGEHLREEVQRRSTHPMVLCGMRRPATLLRTRYAVSGTDAGYAAARRKTPLSSNTTRP